jgi:hypothetical protein
VILTVSVKRIISLNRTRLNTMTSVMMKCGVFFEAVCAEFLNIIYTYFGFEKLIL